jgi:8-amino-7-oxononanoate synthase
VDGTWLLCFVSTDYLGLAAHPRVRAAMAAAAERWGASLSMPRALGQDALTPRLEAAIAALTGHQSALVFPSTTHVALDVMPILAGRDGTFFVDEWAYPISVQGARAARGGKAAIHFFRHDDAGALERCLARLGDVTRKVIVCDGVYVDSGMPAPLDRLVGAARQHGAVLYVDDAHGIGVLGHKPTLADPYGRTGSGTKQHLGVEDGRLIHVGTLSKAFGVPVAFVAATKPVIDLLRKRAPSLVHSSPPGIPVVAAGLTALGINAWTGDRLRERLAERVRRFRNGIKRAGLTPGSPGLFPIQSLHFSSPRVATRAAIELRRKGIWALLQLNTRERPGLAALRFVITAVHRDEDIEEAVSAVASVCQNSPPHLPLADRASLLGDV